MTIDRPPAARAGRGGGCHLATCTSRTGPGSRRPFPRFEGEAVAGGDDRLRDHVLLVQAGLEDGRAGSGDDRMCRGERRVGGAALGESLCEECRLLAAAGFGQGFRPQELVVERIGGFAQKVGLHPTAHLLGPKSPVDPPLLVPGRLERDLSDDGQEVDEKGRAEGRERCLGPGVLVGVAAVRHGALAQGHQAGAQVGLVSQVAVDVLTEVPAAPDMARLGVELVDSGDGTVFDREPPFVVGQVVLSRHRRTNPLLDLDRQERQLLEEELREVWARQGPPARAAEERLGGHGASFFGPRKSERRKRSWQA